MSEADLLYQLAVVGIVALAAVIERWAERPARAWLSAKTKKPAAAGCTGPAGGGIVR